MNDILDEEFVDNSYFTVEEEVIGEGENAQKQMCFRGILSEANSINGNRRVYPKEVLREVFMEAKAKAEKTGQPVFGELEHACFTYNTFKVLTKEGYKPFIELKEGDEVITFGENSLEEYKPIEKIINDSGFESLGIFGERSFLKPEAQEQRVFYVTKRKEN